MWSCHNLSVTHTNWPSNTMFSLLITLHTSRLSWLAINNLLSSLVGDVWVKKLFFICCFSPNVSYHYALQKYQFHIIQILHSSNGVNMKTFLKHPCFYRPVHLCRPWKCSCGHHSGQDYGTGWRHWHQCQDDLQSRTWPGGKLHFCHQNRPSDTGGSGSASQGENI